MNRYESTLGDEYLRGTQEVEPAYAQRTEPKYHRQLVEYLSDLQEYSNTSPYVGMVAAPYPARGNCAADDGRRDALKHLPKSE